MFEALLRPQRIAGLTIPYRIVRTAYSLGKPWVDVDDALIAYHEARASGSATLTDVTAVTTCTGDQGDYL